MALTGPAHGTMALDISMKAYKEKAFFTEPNIFAMISANERLNQNWGAGVKK